MRHLRGKRTGYNYLFEDFQAVDRAGYSIYIYHIDLESANAFRRKHGLPLLPEDENG